MTKQEREQLLLNLFEEAKASSHIFPEYAVAEIVLESAWATSKLATEGLNLFGLKWSKNSKYDKISFPTKEFLDGQWVTVQADFVKYDSIKDCFSDRMNLLVRLSNTYKEYKDALNARTGEEFIKEVSKKWSTDPLRAEKVLDIYNKYKYVFNEEENTTSVSEKLSDFWTNFKSKFTK